MKATHVAGQMTKEGAHSAAFTSCDADRADPIEGRRMPLVPFIGRAA